MDEIKNIFPISIFEIVLIIIGLSILFYCLWKYLVGYGLPDKVESVYALLAVLLFDILWIIAMKVCPIQNLRIKLYPTLAILTFSLVYVVFWIVRQLLSGMMH